MQHVRAKIAEGGRIVIPSEYRQALGARIGDEVILELDGKELRIFTLEQAVERAQRLVNQFVSPEKSLADELIKERRREAWREG